MKAIYIIIVILVAFSCKDRIKSDPIPTEKPAAFSLHGKAFISPAPSLDFMQQLDEKRQSYLADSADIMNTIWYGRFIAYAGTYDKAIQHYTNAIKRFPNEARLFRHRGHRYISVRKFDKAINDFTTASRLIEGTENIVEPDGMPNAQNIPVSTTHGNIWYHLGLAYYLKQDFENALEAYLNCLNTGSSPDNVVSATHWIYMILNRLDRKEEAEDYLLAPEIKMNIIENHAYRDLCLFYKGEITEEELLGVEGAESANDAVLYGLGNYHFYDGKKGKAKEIWSDIVGKASWNSFGFIAAESELFHWED